MFDKLLRMVLIFQQIIKASEHNRLDYTMQQELSKDQNTYLKNKKTPDEAQNGSGTQSNAFDKTTQTLPITEIQTYKIVSKKDRFKRKHDGSFTQNPNLYVKNETEYYFAGQSNSCVTNDKMNSGSNLRVSRPNILNLFRKSSDSGPSAQLNSPDFNDTVDYHSIFINKI